jgi:hypothetical protein
MNDCLHQQVLRIDEDVLLLAAVVAGGIDAVGKRSTKVLETALPQVLWEPALVSTFFPRETNSASTNTASTNSASAKRWRTSYLVEAIINGGFAPRRPRRRITIACSRSISTMMVSLTLPCFMATVHARFFDLVR